MLANGCDHRAPPFWQGAQLVGCQLNWQAQCSRKLIQHSLSPHGLIIFTIFQPFYKRIQQVGALGELLFVGFFQFFQELANTIEEVVALGIQRFGREIYQHIQQISTRSLQAALDFFHQELVGVGWVRNAFVLDGRLNFFQVGQELPGAFGVAQASFHPFIDLSLQHFSHVVREVSFRKDAVSLGIDAMALAVEDIVIFQQMLAHVKVGAFNSLLRLLDHAANQTDFNRYVFIQVEAADQVFNLLAAKQAHEVVFQREVEAGGTRVTLTGGATAELIINAAGFMAL